jgi:hypothetical protein
MSLITRKISNGRTTEELITLPSAVASAILAALLSPTNILQLETAGVAIVCLSYLDANSPAHMRYSVRRLRCKLPNATIMLGCWVNQAGSGLVRIATRPVWHDIRISILAGRFLPGD